MIELSIKKKLHTQEGNIALDINLHIKKGSFTALYGKSGVGKTTILKILAGLVKPEQGFIIKGGAIWNDTSRKIFVKPQDRNIGFVFQDYALFPNMTVKENIEFSCSGKKDMSFVNQLLEITSLSMLSDKYPVLLSGGQKQRVALARALARKPQLLLLDEPFSSLDSETKLNLYSELKNIHELFGLTTILVSHCLEEVKTLCEKIVVIKNGKILKQGNPKEIFTRKEEEDVKGIVLDVIEENGGFTIVTSTGSETIKVVVEKISQIKTGDKIIIKRAENTH